MKRFISLKINVLEIEKQRLFVGQKGTYLDAVVFLDDDPDQYGNNGMITQSVSQGERENGTRGNILGNAKIIKVMGEERQPTPSQSAPQSTGQQAPSESPKDDEDDIPF